MTIKKHHLLKYDYNIASIESGLNDGKSLQNIARKNDWQYNAFYQWFNRNYTIEKICKRCGSKAFYKCIKINPACSGSEI